MPGQQLHGLLRRVLDPDVIDPEPFARFHPGLFRQEIHRDAHGDPSGRGGMVEKRLHLSQTNLKRPRFQTLNCSSSIRRLPEAGAGA
jgi:hypothetical protein